MRNLKALSRNELQTISGGVETNCHCHGSTASSPIQGRPAIDIISPSAAQCFNSCACYRGEASCVN
ncbi:bacteriocin-like protein [Chryseobacterium tongliaoense]|uniref:bacteriocin-like protein n=1 Tax=Chryseobacterium tongliaoense TaxID=3240933 RepID=UPI003F7A34A7